jgi:hypothetical protein
MTKHLQGGCQCGALRYQARAEPSVVTLCHCAMCRRSVGAQSVTWASFSRDDLTIEGDTLRWYDSSSRARRGFCERCGTSLFFVGDASAGLVDVTVGSLDQPESCPPTCHIWVPSKVTWVALEPGVPAHVADSESPLMP